MSSTVQEVQAALSGWPDESVGLWFLLRTRSRQEKVIANDFGARGIGHFLPLVTCTRFYGDRKARVELPLFPGYVFLRGMRDDAYTADRSGRIAQIISVPNQARLDRELKNIYLALGVNAVLDPFPYLKVGVRVQVREGPFRGLEGVIQDRA